jgi:hypothetical protein
MGLQRIDFSYPLGGKRPRTMSTPKRDNNVLRNLCFKTLNLTLWTFDFH